MRVSRYSTNSTGYTFHEWRAATGVRESHLTVNIVSYRKMRDAWEADEDPCDWLQAVRQIEEAHRLGLEADLDRKPEPPWAGKDLFTIWRRRAWMRGFHFSLYSRSRDGEGYVGPGVRPCRRGTCGDDRCHRLREAERERTVTEVMER